MQDDASPSWFEIDPKWLSTRACSGLFVLVVALFHWQTQVLGECKEVIIEGDIGSFTYQVLLRHNSMLPRKIIWSLINRFWHFKVKHCFIHTLFRQLEWVGTDVPVRTV